MSPAHEMAGIRDTLETAGGQLGQEARLVEAVFGGVFQQSAINPAVEGGRGDLFEVKAAAGLEDPGDLGNGGLPLGDVVQDAEVEDRVEGTVRKREVFGGSRNERRAGASPTREAAQIDIDSTDVTRAEALDQNPDTGSATATDFKHAPTFDSCAEVEKDRGFEVALHKRSHGVVDQQALGPVESHTGPVKRKQRAKGVRPASASRTRPDSRATRSHSARE